MQTPEGTMEPFSKLLEAEKESQRLERATGKPHPTFLVGEELMIKGGRFRVHKILRNRMMLKPVKY